MTQIFQDYSTFLDRQDQKTNGVSKEFAAANPNWEKENESNEACWNCSDCSDCSGCSRCSRCSPEIPVIENVHQKVLEAVTSSEKALNMSDWHTCDTAHCRAGWVIHLAGEKGYALEKATQPDFAAYQIYKASSPVQVSFPRFYEDNFKAMADIKRCAEEEAKLSTPAES